MYIVEYGDFKGPINLYTAMPGHPELENLLHRVNATISCHDKESLVDTIELWDSIGEELSTTTKVKLAPGLHQYARMMSSIIEDWEIETFDWIEDCPLPDNEVFMRI